MKRSIAMLLAVLTLTGTLTLPSLAAEPERGRDRPGGGPGGGDPPRGGPAEPRRAGARPGGDGELGQPGQPHPGGEPERPDSVREHHGIEEIDYDQMYEDLRRQLNDIANAQWYITMMGGGLQLPGPGYDSLRDTFEI